MKDAIVIDNIQFIELEGHFGLENAREIVRTLERIQGLYEVPTKLSYKDRLAHVFEVMAAEEEVEQGDLSQGECFAV